MRRPRRPLQQDAALPLLLPLLGLLLLSLAGAAATEQQPRPEQPLARSVLYIVVDDLTADLAVFGGRIQQASTPNLDRLARRATRFTRAYAQQAVCGPSRNSFLSGRYPDQIRVYTFVRSFRDDLPDAVSLPQAFKERGYLTCGFGKVFHDDGVLSPPDYDQPFSWSEECPYYAPEEDVCDPPVHGWCNPSMPQANFTDARGVDAAIGRLEQLAAAAGGAGAAAAGGGGDGRQGVSPPFFFAVGIRKPHLDWAFPRPFLEQQVLQDDIVLPPFAQRLTPEAMPPVAWWNCSEETPWKVGLPGVLLHPTEPLPDALTQELRRAYLGAVSWMDHEVGRLLEALDTLGLAQETAVVFHSDHGFHLGDGGAWCKQTTTELATRVPLLVALPPNEADEGPNGGGGAVREEIVELVDVYPTLLDMAGLPPDPALPGRSLVPLLLLGNDDGPSQQAAVVERMGANEAVQELLLGQLPEEETGAGGILAHGAAFSQFPRCASAAWAPSSLAEQGFAWNRQCMMLGNAHIDAMGYAVRVHRWRYAEWLALDPATWMPRWNDTDGRLGVELYAMDRPEMGEEGGRRARNVVGEEPAVAGRLSRVLQRHFWPLLRPKRAGDADVSSAVAASRWGQPPPPGQGDAVGLDEEFLKEAWGGLWRGDGGSATMTS